MLFCQPRVANKASLFKLNRILVATADDLPYTGIQEGERWDFAGSKTVYKSNRIEAEIAFHCKRLLPAFVDNIQTNNGNKWSQCCLI